MKVEFILPKPWHIGQMARLMRAEHHGALLRLGVDVHRELRSTFFSSYYIRAATIDGRLAALWGVMGNYLHFAGCLWLVLTDEATRHPMVVARHAKREIDQMMVGKMLLETSVIPGDEAAQRFAAFLGFHPGEPPVSGTFTKKGRKEIVDAIRDNPDLIGSHGQVEVYYRPEVQRGVE